ncbi:TlpA disulfide reductase family protein [Bacteroides sp.]|uniref:TlpA disulfide reductase family protein n=1 Tax=Bacteroides sp. TaxID=29523 RepID=UPI00262C8501|nr:TlpA disulfide reductase family protein [Bacteroides sp.]MDD3038195.1 TlpA disulfide reductase family protein [Bacteroides sp.]
MKRTFSLSLIVIFACFCYAQQKVATYIVKGLLSDSTMQGETIFMLNYENSEKINSAKVLNGKFQFTGEVETPFLAKVYAGKHYGICIIEKGTIILDLEKTHTTSGLPIVNPALGTPLNNEFANLKTSIDSLSFDAYEQQKQIQKESADSYTRAKLEKELITKIRETIIPQYQEVFKQHKNDVLGAYTITQLSKELSPDETALIIAQAGPYIMSLPSIQNIVKQLEKLKQTSEGKMFVDFEGKDANGEPLKLSNFVGKGKYTLVSFWSRSCGGCRVEIPIIAEIYKQFGNKELEVVGVAVNEGSVSTKKAIKELNVIWPQLFETGSQPYELYGFSYIPQIMLFGPDGTIIARNLRGDGIKVKVKEVLKPL